MTQMEESLTQKLVWAAQRYEQLVTELVEAQQEQQAKVGEDEIELSEKEVEVMDKITDHVAEVKAVITAHTHHLLADPVELKPGDFT